MIISRNSTKIWNLEYNIAMPASHCETVVTSWTEVKLLLPLPAISMERSRTVTTRRVRRTVAQWLENVFTALPALQPPGSPPCPTGARLEYSPLILAVTSLSKLSSLSRLFRLFKFSTLKISQFTVQREWLNLAMRGFKKPLEEYLGQPCLVIVLQKQNLLISRDGKADFCRPWNGAG